jgi:hypothetical protein
MVAQNNPIWQINRSLVLVFYYINGIIVFISFFLLKIFFFLQLYIINYHLKNFSFAVLNRKIHFKQFFE